MMITNSSFPMVKILSYTPLTTPAKIPIKTLSVELHKHPKTIQGLTQHLQYIQQKNEEAKNKAHVNHYIGKDLQLKIDQDETYRAQSYKTFEWSKQQTSSGTMLYGNSGQMVYVLLNQADTKTLKNLDGIYLGVASFQGNYFLHFEEGIITDNGIKITDISFYAQEMRAGTLLATVTTFLSYINNKPKLLPLEQHLNTTSENIYYVD